MQVLPRPYEQAWFEHLGRELTRSFEMIPTASR